MTASITVQLPGGYELLAGVETLPVGSAKVPHLQVLPDVIAAADEEAAAAAVQARRAELEAFAARLELEGLGSMASTARRALGAGRWNADLASLLEWIYGATFKTAGRATMSFAPWYVDESAADPTAHLAGSAGQAGRIRLTPGEYDGVSAANATVYERLVGAINASAHVAGEATPSSRLLAAVAAAAQAGDLPKPRFAEPSDLKCMLKVDYKLGQGGVPIVIDVSAGLIGTLFDDLLLDALPAAAGVLPERVTPRLLDAVVERFASERGEAPRSGAVLVLDVDMYEQWAAAELDGLRALLSARVTGPRREFPVLTLAALEAWADDTSGAPPATLAAPWSGVPELLFAYSCRVGELVRPSTYGKLRAAGAVIVDERRHALAAAKELGVSAVFGEDVERSVTVPDAFVLDPTGEMGDSFGGDAGEIVDAAWERAMRLGWDVLALKTGKVRRASGSGDYPTALIYPVTAVGRRLATRGLRRVLTQVAAAGSAQPRLVLTRVEAAGGYETAPGERHDIEVRTYVLPVIRR